MPPPTYSSRWNLFESLGTVGFLRRRVDLGRLEIGSSRRDSDVEGGATWKAFEKSDALFRRWGPPRESPWSPFHRPTLFAALDAAKRVAPAAPDQPVPGDAPREPPPYVKPKTAIVLDLPAVVSVTYGAWLARVGGLVPVVTFNNWPHPKGLLDMAPALAALLYYSPWLAGTSTPDAASRLPVFLLDADRFRAREPKRLDFDNRYFLMEADLPSAQYFLNHGVEHVVYVRPAGAPQDEDDVNAYLHGLRKQVGLEIARVDERIWSTMPATDFAPTVRKTALSTSTDPMFKGFRRSAAGGFGVLIPDRSSGSG